MGCKEVLAVLSWSLTHNYLNTQYLLSSTKGDILDFLEIIGEGSISKLFSVVE